MIAHGGDFPHFIIQLTLRGLEPDELARPDIVPEEIGAVEIYVWNTTGGGGAL